MIFFGLDQSNVLNVERKKLVGSPELDLVYGDSMTPNRYKLLSRALAVEHTKGANYPIFSLFLKNLFVDNQDLIVILIDHRFQPHWVNVRKVFVYHHQ